MKYAIGDKVGSCVGASGHKCGCDTFTRFVVGQERDGSPKLGVPICPVCAGALDVSEHRYRMKAAERDLR